MTKKILFFGAFLFLVLGSEALAVTDADCKSLDAGFYAVDGVCFPAGTGLSEKPMKDIFITALNWLLSIFGFFGIITFIVSGIFYLTAAGDAEQEKKAKNAMKMGILGIIVGLSGFVVIQAINAALRGGIGF